MQISADSNISKEQSLLLKIARNIIQDPNKRITEEDTYGIDWLALYRLAIDQKVFNIVFYSVINFLPKNHSLEYINYNNRMMNRQRKIIDEINNIMTKCNKHGIKIAIIKGIVYSQLIYNNPYIRTFGDIDILVDEEDVKEVHNFLKELGYTQQLGRGAEENIILDFPILKHYREYKYQSEYHNYIKTPSDINDFRVVVELQRSIHTTIFGNDFKQFLQNTQEISVENKIFRTLDNTHLFIYLLENVYNDTEKIGGPIKLKEYIDLFLFLKRFGESINWILIRDLCNKYEMLHLVHRVLDNLFQIYDITLPPEIVNLFNINNATYDVRDTGTGYLINWKSNFLHRLFNLVDRNKEIVQILKENAYNVNISKPRKKVPLIHGESKDYLKKDFITFFDDLYGDSISYAPIKDEKNKIVFICTIDSQIINRLGEVEIAFHFIEGPPNYSEKLFLLSKSNDDTYYLTYEDHIKSERYLVEKMDGFLVIRIPNVIKPYNGLIAYNIFVREWINLLKSPYKRSISMIIGSENKMGSYRTYWNPSLLQID